MLESWEVKAYEALTDAVIEHAVRDYFFACKTLQRRELRPKCRSTTMTEAYRLKKDCETFFMSEYCSWLLPDGGGPRMLERLETVVESDAFRRARYVSKRMIYGMVNYDR